jgi:hypothetical protein
MRPWTFLSVFALVLSVAPAAKADLLFTGSQTGFCCFNVELQTVSTTDVKVTVTLTGGATLFASTGNGTNHPGFAFNLSGDAITASNIQNASDLGTFHVGPDATNGPDMGTFDYFFDIPGSGTSAGDDGPLSFEVVRKSGVAVTDFGKNSAGFYFEADILNGTTGESGISAAPTSFASSVPEPGSIVLLGSTTLIAAVFMRRRSTRQSEVRRQAT